MRQPYRNQPLAHIGRIKILRDARWYRPLHRRPTDTLLGWMAKTPLRIPFWVFWVVRANLRALRLYALYAQNSSKNPAKIPRGDGRGFGLERCDVLYINLDHRTDRREQFEAEMKRLGVKEYQRVPGVVASPGILGCTLAHINLLESWSRNPERLLLVCEDDVEFVTHRQDVDAVIEEFFAAPELKVLMLAHNAAWRIPISPRLALSSDIATTAAFVVRNEVVIELLEVFRKASEMLQNGVPSRQAALDIVWRELQQQRLFALVTPRCAVQRPGYSDIGCAITNYGV